MDWVKDKIILPKEFPFRIFTACGSTDLLPILHRHDCLELNFVKSGSGINIIGDTSYIIQKGEFYIINSYENHYATSDGSLDLLVMIFDPLFIWLNNTFDYGYLKPFFERKLYFHNRLDANTMLCKDIGDIMLEIEREYLNNDPGYELIIKALTLKILALLYRHLKLENQLNDSAFEKHKTYERIKDAVLYIENNFLQEIKLQELAKIAYMTPTYFSSYFKKVMQFSLTQYVTYLRMNYSARLLKETTKNISEIYAESGFSSLSHFNKIFKNLTNLTPTQYRNNYINQKN